ncbi:MAG: N-acetylmuramoyl-L-alanine amidase family protein [Terracidiphilus sp.]
MKFSFQRLIAASGGLVVVLTGQLLLAQTPSAPPAPEAPKFVVVLVAAHGGSDFGAKIGNQAEKDLTLSMSVKLRSLLMARGIYVVTTRESDANINPDRRAEIANHANAAACLDLHAAQASGKNAPAVHLFLSSLPAAKHAGLTPWRTAQSASIRRSMTLAGTLNSALTQTGVPVTLGRAPLATVDSMTCPAVAVEIAMQPAQDGGNDSGFESKVLDAVAAAILEWRADGAQLNGVRQP